MDRIVREIRLTTASEAHADGFRKKRRPEKARLGIAVLGLKATAPITVVREPSSESNRLQWMASYAAAS